MQWLIILIAFYQNLFWDKLKIYLCILSITFTFSFNHFVIASFNISSWKFVMEQEI